MAKKTFLDFEQPVAELEAKIEELRYVQTESAVDITLEIDQLSKKSQQLTKDIYSDLTPWQITKIARHPERPYTLDYIHGIFTDFVEMHGDRHFADDLSIVGGLAVSRPFCWPSTMQAWPLKRAKPPTIDKSSAKWRSPCISTKSVKMPWM